MKTQTFWEDIKNTYRIAIERGQKIEINRYIPYIAIDRNEDEYFFQGAEAEEFFEQFEDFIRSGVLGEDITIEQWLLWSCQGW